MSIDRTLAALPGMTADQREQLRRNAEHWRDTGTPRQQSEGSRVLAALEAQPKVERAALAARLGNLDQAGRVVEAFRAVPMTETEGNLLQVLLDNPGSTSTELSRAMGWGGMSWHLHFGEMCKKRTVYLWPAERVEERDGYFYSGILAAFANDGSRFTMRSEVVTALEALGLRGRS